MNIYLISSPRDLGYDEFSAAVVAAVDEEAARHMHPREDYTWSDERRQWEDSPGNDAWTKWPVPKEIAVELIGIEPPACRSEKPHTILASYHAG